MASINEEGERDLEMGIKNLEPPSPSPTPSPRAAVLVVSNSGKSLAASNSGKALVVSNSGKALLMSNSGKALLVSNSGKRIDQSGKKKYVKQVTGRHNDTELHLAAQKGDVAGVRQILGEIDEQMIKTMSGAEFDAEVEEIRAVVVNEVNELGETALFTAAEKGYIDIVKELLPYTTNEGIRTKNRSGFDPLHIAASQGRHDIVQLLLEHDPTLSKTVGQSNATPLVSAATKGHLAVVEELLSKDSSLLEISRSNGKNALHLSARQGHVGIVKALLDKDPQLARRTDKKGQTALHMAVKGLSSAVVKLLLRADPAIVMLPDKFGNTALHIATRKKRAEIVHELLLLRDTNVNALTRDHKTALDIAEGLPLSEEIVEIKECLSRYAIFTVPGGDGDDGMAVVVNRSSFKVFFISNALALFTSLAVVVVQITVVRGEIKSERRVVEVINKLMWLASVCTSVAFIASAYIVVGRHHKWAAILVTVIGGVTMAGVLSAMTYYVVKSRKIRRVRKKEKSNSWRRSESDSEVNPIYAI
ncbi:hypothetical protein BUALT_Bualt09G0067000 [Buddleja alternifolia]|uniref:PGG domain-containing protein n=1 Tax=Buddleja alternifolia TaxID=168488 RepID=A0AAV6X7T9_9LAMI|nr:hypothetical protein BUALT_Bualt09G0067000 [Buddleja alternifolia]